MAARYWVGGTSSWDATAGTKWATSSGGAGGAAIPTAADDVYFDANSGASTVTLSSSSVARSIDCNGFNGTISHPASVTVNIGDATAGVGNIALRLATGMTYTIGSNTTSILNFISTSATQQTITSVGKTMPSYTINGAGSSYILGDANTINTNSTVTLTAGTFNTGNFACSWGLLSSSNSNTRTITLGSSVVTFTGVSGNVINFATSTNLTFNAGTSQVIISGAGSYTLQLGGRTFYRFDIGNSNRTTINGSNTFNDFRMLASTARDPDIWFQTDNTFTSNLQLAGTNPSDERLLVRASSLGGTNVTLTCNGTITLTNVCFMNITGAGTATWSGTSIGNAGGNSNITFTTPVTRYWVGNGGGISQTAHWSTSSGGAGGASVPLPQDQAIFDANSFSTTGQTVDVQNGGGWPSSMRVPAMNWTGVTNNPAWNSNQSHYMCGSVVFSPNMTIMGAFGRTITGSSGPLSLTMNGISWAGGDLTINASSAVTFNDAYATTSGRVVFLSGDWTVNGNITCDGIGLNGTVTRTMNMGSGTWDLGGTAPWSGSSLANLTINTQTSTVKLTNNSTSNKNFGVAVSGYTFNVLWIATGNTGTVTFTSSGTTTYTTLKIDAGRPVKFTSGTTSVIGTWDASGTSGNLITIESTSAGSAFTFSKSSGTVSADYLSLKDSTATGGASWYAGANSTDVSGNTGWIFTAAPFDWTVNVNDNITVTEAIAKAVAKSVAENVTATEAISKAYGKAVSDGTVTITEAVAKALGINQSDSIAITEATAFNFAKNIAESITITEEVVNDATEGADFGGNIIEIENFQESNVLETTYLASAAAVDDTTITVKSGNNINADYFAMIGRPASEEVEFIAIESVTDNVVTLVSALKRAHLQFTQVLIIKADQIRIYSAESVDGSEPDVGDYTIVAPIIIDPDEVTTTYTDSSGTSLTKYRFTYYNSVKDSESLIGDTPLIQGTFIGTAYGDYVTIEEIRRTAGLQNNKNVSDNLINEKRQAAQAFINSTLVGRYTLPFSKPINPLIAEITRKLAAGYLLTQELSSSNGRLYAEGQAMIDGVMNDKKTGLLDKLNDGRMTLLGETQTSLEASSAGNFVGWPDATTATADASLGGAERMFRMSDIY